MKLRNKLILSCAALAAVATTAVSTTYAWYTANDTVKASGVTGKTSEQDATLLLISTTGRQGQWGSKVTIDSSAVTLEPLAYSSGSYYEWDPSSNVPANTATSGGLTANDKYISFYLYFKSGSNQDLNVNVSTFNLRNTTGITESVTTAALPTFNVLADGTGASGATYSVDMLKATNVVLTVENGTELASDSASSPAVTNAGVRTAYAADSEALAGTIGNDANAHTYYNNVKSLTTDALDTTIVSSETGASYSSVANLNPHGTNNSELTTLGHTGAGAQSTLDNILMVRFDIYLDGWDKLCFDACRKQTFALDMEFSASNYTPANNG